MLIGGEEEPQWIACDKCDSWLHVKCTDNLESTLGREEIELNWICGNRLAYVEKIWNHSLEHNKKRQRTQINKDSNWI